MTKSDGFSVAFIFILNILFLYIVYTFLMFFNIFLAIFLVFLLTRALIYGILKMQGTGEKKRFGRCQTVYS